jgi:hypothetical protein
MAKKRISWRNRRVSTRLIRNIITVYHSATSEERVEGLFWYQTAHNDAMALATRHGVTLEQAIGVIAALSPGREWGMNLLDADKLIGAFVNGRPTPTVGTYGRKNVNKALDILRGNAPLDVLPPTGPKVRAFYALILNPDAPDGTPCVDRHAKAIALGKVLPESDVAVAVAHYTWYAVHYVEASKALGLLPHQVQAITWLAWRRAKGNDEIPF